MNIIVTISDRRFSLNGIQYLKNYITRISGNRLTIKNCYDGSDVLLPLTVYTDFTVNGLTYDSASLLQAALLDVLYSRNTLGGDSPEPVFQNNFTKFIPAYWPGNTQPTESDIADWINANLTFTVNENQSKVFIRFFAYINETYYSLIYDFGGGTGTWGANPDGLSDVNPVLQDRIKLLGQFPVTITDIENNDQTNIIALGAIEEGDFLYTANSEERDFSDASKQHYFSYYIGDVLYFALFIGEPGLYGGSNDPFTESDFADITNSDITPVPNINEVTQAGNTIFGNEHRFVKMTAGVEEFAHVIDEQGHYFEKDGFVVNTNYADPVANVEYKIPAKEADDTYAMMSDISAIPVENFGAVGDGEVNDWQAIQDAVDSSYGTILLNGNYSVSRPVIVPSNKTLVINGTVKMQAGVISSLAANFSIGSNTVQVTGASTKYFVGQQVCINDNNSTLANDGTGQTKRYASSFFITNVSGDTITLDQNTDINYTTAAGAKIGHCQSVFLVDGKNNVTIKGFGTIDQNKSAQYECEPITVNITPLVEEVRFGVGISINNAVNTTLEGISVINGILHNIQFKNCVRIYANNIISQNGHDKNILLWYCRDFNFSNIITKGADFGDGIYMHNDCYNGTLKNVDIEDCGRYGLGIGIAAYDVFVSDVVVKNCGTSGYFSRANKIDVRNFKSIGGGVRRYITTAQPLFLIDRITESSFAADIREPGNAATGISIQGLTSFIKVYPTVKGLTASSSSNGTGLVIAPASGNSPNNIEIINPIITNNKTGVNLFSGVINIKTLGGDISGNTTNLTNNAGSEFKPIGTVNAGSNDLLVFDSAPLSGSLKAVQSGGVFNALAALYQDWPETPYSETITWNGTAPSGTLTANWRATRIGKKITLRVNAVYSSAGATNTTAVIPLPAGLPLPSAVTGFNATNDFPLAAQGYIMTSTLGTPPASRAAMRKVAAGPALHITAASAAAIGFIVTIDYWID